MPWCPKCNAEYIDGITMCHDCGVELVDYDYEKDKKFELVICYKDKVLLTIVEEITEYRYIRSMFICENIHYWGLCQGVDNYLTVVTGFCNFPLYIYVTKNDLARAKQIVASYVGK